MENNWPETVEELLAECQRLVSKTDLYELGERGKPFTGESEPRVDGTDYLAGEYMYGVAMIPAQWVTYVLGNATLGCGECEMETDWDYLHDGIPDAPEDTWAYMCSACGWSFRYDRGIKPKHCPNCGKAVKR